MGWEQPKGVWPQWEGERSRGVAAGSISHLCSLQQEIWAAYFHTVGSLGNLKPSEHSHMFTVQHSGSCSFPIYTLSSPTRSYKAVNSNDILIQQIKGSFFFFLFLSQFNSCKKWDYFRQSQGLPNLGGLCLVKKSPQIIWYTCLQNAVSNPLFPWMWAVPRLDFKEQNVEEVMRCHSETKS